MGKEEQRLRLEYFNSDLKATAKAIREGKQQMYRFKIHAILPLSLMRLSTISNNSNNHNNNNYNHKKKSTHQREEAEKEEEEEQEKEEEQVSSSFMIHTPEKSFVVTASSEE